MAAIFDIRNNIFGWKTTFLSICLLSLVWLTYHQFYVVPVLNSSYDNHVLAQNSQPSKPNRHLEVEQASSIHKTWTENNQFKSVRVYKDVSEKAYAVKESENSTIFTTIERDSAREYIQKISSRRKIIQTVSCKQIFDNNKTEIKRAMLHMLSKRRIGIAAQSFTNMTKNCDEFRRQKGYIDISVTDEEKDFPIAFSIVAYKRTEQIERLLRAIYRPQNFYCIHLDNKTNPVTMQAVKAMASCLTNVFVSNTSVSVNWAGYSVLEAELVCMRDLWEYKGWKYFINLTGQEFPLKTNLELVRILEAMKGANIVGGSRNRVKYRNTKRYIYASRPPHRIRAVKGPVHVAINRAFVDFALHDYRSLDLLDWLKDTLVPDESFFSTLNYNPHLGIPGSFLGDPEEYPEKPLFTRYKNWQYPNGDYNRPCSGYYIRHICITGVGDLHRVSDTLGLFLNKVILDYQPLAFECLEELMFNRTIEQYLNGAPVDVSRYKHLDQVKYRLIK